MALEHIHPMIVHFPIVLLLLAAALDGLNGLRGVDFAGTAVLARSARLALYGGAMAAAAAVGFGYVAQGIAIDHGFSDALIETHEGLGVTTAVTFAVLALGRATAVRAGFALAGGRGRLVAALTFAGVLLLLTTAYHGGQLVYGHGVNVAGVKPPV